MSALDDYWMYKANTIATIEWAKFRMMRNLEIQIWQEILSEELRRVEHGKPYTITINALNEQITAV